MTKPIQSETGVMLVREDTGETRVIGLRNRIVGPWKDAFYVRVVGDWWGLSVEQRASIFAKVMATDMHIPTSFEPYYDEGSKLQINADNRHAVLRKHGLEGE